MAKAKRTAPKWIKGDKVAAAEFVRLAAMLAEDGRFRPGDENELAMYCATFSQYQSLLAAVRADGAILQRRRGKDLYVSPALRVANELLNLLDRLGCEFGLTPASRGRMKLPQAPSKGAGKGFLERHLSELEVGKIADEYADWEPPDLKVAGEQRSAG